MFVINCIKLIQKKKKKKKNRLINAFIDLSNCIIKCINLNASVGAGDRTTENQIN